ncbi:hypothetical protein SBADM41S_05739 [Streptomyces badius]
MALTCGRTRGLGRHAGFRGKHRHKDVRGGVLCGEAWDAKRLSGRDEDPRVAELRMAVSRLRRELAAVRTDFFDRPMAEEVAGGPGRVGRRRRASELAGCAVPCW